MNPKAILFDWDNTLVETMGVINDAFNHTLSHFGHPPIDIEVTRNTPPRSARETFSLYFGLEAQKALDIFYDYMHALPIHARFTLLPGALDTIPKLATLGIPMAVVSNKKGDLLRLEVGHLGWDRFFTVTVGSGDAIRDKPSPDPVHLALSHLNQAPGQDVWFIGDSHIDWECAQASGCRPISLHTTPHHHDILHITDFTHLEEIMGLIPQERLAKR